MNTDIALESLPRLTGEMTYTDYRRMIDNLLAENKTTGENHSEMMVDYTKMNVTRMNRIDKHVKLTDELAGFAASLERPQTWVVLTEAWCGDAAQIVPVMHKISESANGQINLKLVLRDQNLELMDHFLTNGGRSIPKLIVRDAETDELLFDWGPRPAPAQQLVTELKQKETPFKEAAEELHKWYAKDKTMTTQDELLTRLKTFTSEP